MDNQITPAGAAIDSNPLLDRSELIAILEETLSVTDEWGGCKLASWQWGHNVIVDGMDAAADAILARLSLGAKRRRVQADCWTCCICGRTGFDKPTAHGCLNKPTDWKKVNTEERS